MCRVFHGKHLSDSDSEFTSSTWCVRDGKMNCVQYCCVQSLPALFGSLVSRVVTSLQRTPRHSCFVDKSWCSISCWQKRCMGEHMCVSCCCSRISSVCLYHVLSSVSSYGDTTNGSTTYLSSQLWCVNVTCTYAYSSTRASYYDVNNSTDWFHSNPVLIELSKSSMSHTLIRSRIRSLRRCFDDPCRLDWVYRRLIRLENIARTQSRDFGVAGGCRAVLLVSFVTYVVVTT